VESITDPGVALKDFIVGEVVTAEKHPNADKLRLCTVSDGKDSLQIVCGAPNARAGIKVCWPGRAPPFPPAAMCSSWAPFAAWNRAA
jgi:phenylalanyl-tRNA synthetase beta chain